jgi:tetratricopeptide (TPR) repeat protein
VPTHLERPLKIQFLSCSAVIALTSGCYHGTIDTGLTPSAQTVEKSWASAWVYGLVPPSTVETSRKCPNGAARIETQRSFTNSLVNFLTGGIYTPMAIKVTCAQGQTSLLPVPVPPESGRPVPTPSTVPPARRVVSSAPTPAETSPGEKAQIVIGAPRSEADRAAAAEEFGRGKAYVGSHEWAKAEQSFQRAILFDGSVAEYQAAMGSLMMILHRWADAEAAYSAAVLLDVDNPEYRRQLKEARSRR